ncbi:MAG: hypothetical protein HFJ43_03150 [Clostridia bacterium]|nr:hypothetical protein [Clostridia bacterium]
MKKYVFTTIILSAISLFSVACIVNASFEVSNEQAEKSINSLVTFKSTEFIENLNNSEEKINSISKESDSTTNSTFYKVDTDNYTLRLDEDNKDVIGIYSKTISDDVISSSSKNEAKDFITAKYAELNLPSEYDLVYLEKFDDVLWEADFQKEYNGVYNKYEAVKVFFTPETKEIAALSVFDTPYSDEKEVNITSEEAKNKANDNLELDSKIVDSELTIVQGNEYFNEETDTDLHKAWVLSTEKNEFVFVDASTGDIIGGDCINE